MNDDNLLCDFWGVPHDQADKLKAILAHFHKQWCAPRMADAAMRGVLYHDKEPTWAKTVQRRSLKRIKI